MARQVLDGETVLANWELKQKDGAKAMLVLTDLRVWHEIEGRGRYDLTSLAIDEVQWAGVGRRHSPLLLVLAAIFAVIGIVGAVAASSGAPLGTLLISLILGIIYLLTRRGELSIGGGTALIRQVIGGAAQDRDAALAFVSKVEQRSLVTRAQPRAA